MNFVSAPPFPKNHLHLNNEGSEVKCLKLRGKRRLLSISLVLHLSRSLLDSKKIYITTFATCNDRKEQCTLHRCMRCLCTVDVIAVSEGTTVVASVISSRLLIPSVQCSLISHSKNSSQNEKEKGGRGDGDSGCGKTRGGGIG